MKKEQIIKDKQVDHILNEYRIFSTINHPFIVTLLSPRSTSMESPRTLDISIFSWSTSREENFSLISEIRVFSNHRKQRNLVTI